MNCPHTVALGGYLLGALEPEDRSTFETHLHGCEICRAELVRLSPLPGLLHQISLEDFEDLPEPDAMPPPADGPVPVTVAEEPIVLDATRAPEPPYQQPRRRYWMVAAAAALVMVLTVGGILGYRALQEPAQQVASGITWSATDSTTGVHGDAELVQHGWGTQVNIRLEHVEPNKPCWLVVKGRDGAKQIAGWWKTESDAVDAIPAPTAYAVKDIAKIEVMTVPDNPDADEAKRLVTLSPDGHEYPPS